MHPYYLFNLIALLKRFITKMRCLTLKHNNMILAHTLTYAYNTILVIFDLKINFEYKKIFIHIQHYNILLILSKRLIT